MIFDRKKKSWNVGISLLKACVSFSFLFSFVLLTSSCNSDLNVWMKKGRQIGLSQNIHPQTVTLTEKKFWEGQKKEKEKPSSILLIYRTLHICRKIRARHVDKNCWKSQGGT